MPTWEIAILRCIEQLGGTAELAQVYANINRFKELLPHHLKASRYGGRPEYVHQVRRHITNLCRHGDLTQTEPGSYAITGKARSRLQETPVGPGNGY